MGRAEGDVSTASTSRARGRATSKRRVFANRLILVLTLAAIVAGVALGHTLITWLNATLL